MVKLIQLKRKGIKLGEVLRNQEPVGRPIQAILQALLGVLLQALLGVLLQAQKVVALAV